MGQTASVNAPHGVVTFDIAVEGKALDASVQVMSLTVCRELSKIPFARIVVRDGDAATQDFAVSSSGVFTPGQKISINLGRDGNNQPVFKGIITRQSIRIQEKGNTELHVECRDETVRMTLGRHSRYFEKVKDSQVFDELVSRYAGLQVDSKATTLVHKQLVQHHVSDWDFMVLRAEANGMFLDVFNGHIKIARPDTTATPAGTIAFGSTVFELEAEMDARTQWKNVQAKSWDYSNQGLFEADTDSVSFHELGDPQGSDLAGKIAPGNYELHHGGFLLQQELQDWVEATLIRSRLGKVRGRAKVSGTMSMEVTDMVTLTGLGNRFNGSAFVTGIRHEMGNGVWDTHIQFGADPQPYAVRYFQDINDSETAGLVGGIHGLQIGKVVQLQNDPDGENRILVRTPTTDNQARGIWTRVASLDAGSDRGAFFMPEIDDEVILGFINDDPRHAVVLGMLHSSARPAPLTAQDANNEKGFTTRSKMHIQFNDQTRTLTIDTPAGNRITLDEAGSKVEIKDQNSNKLTMDTTGISLESPMNIAIKAGADLSLSAGASLSIGGASVSMKADANVSVQGALAKLSAQGIMEIDGSLVKIN